MPKIFIPSGYSLSTKVVLSLLVFIFFFLTFKYALVIPKVKEDAFDNEVKNIATSLVFVKEQMEMATKAIRAQTFQESDFIKEKIVSHVKDLKFQSQNLENDALIEALNKNYFSKFCGYKLTSKDFTHKKVKGKDLFKKNNPNILDTWQSFVKKNNVNIVQKKSIYLIFNTKLDLNRLLTLECHIRTFNPSHEAFEESLRTHIQKNLSLLESTINSKTAILWINPELKDDSTKPLFIENEKLRQKRYRLSKLSNTNILLTGNLSAKEILDARDKKPLEYKVNGKDVLSWIVNLSNENSTNFYTLIYTVNKKDILKRSNSKLFVLLPETLIALMVSIFLLLLILKYLFSII